MTASIDRTELLRLTEAEDAQIVDVLPESEYTEAHLPGAVNIPLKQLTAETAAILSLARPVVVYCHDGLCDMSPRAACRLEALGFTVYDYVDGIADWKAAGLPTEGTAEQGQTVADAIRTEVPTCRPDETIGEIRPRVVDAGWEVCVVVDCDGMVIGRIRDFGLDTAPGQLAVEVMEPGPSTVRPDGQLKPLIQRMQDRNAPHVIVTTPQGKLLGILLRDEAAGLLAGETPERIWRDCDCCPGRWTSQQEAT
ncbi:MAG: rhodanese-like domain-containing protein [Acidimicrobiia bacterium]